ARRTRRGTASSRERSTGTVRGARALSRRTRRGPGGSPASPGRSSRRRCCRESSSNVSTTSRACPRSPHPATSRGSTTAGSSSEFDRYPVVDPAEDERAEHERRRGRDDEVHDVREPWRVAEPERVADGVDRRCERVPPAQRVQERVVALYALRQLREAPEDRRQEEPRQQGGRDQVL